MRVRFRDLLFTAALIAGVVMLYALQRSREHTPAPVTEAPASVTPANAPAHITKAPIAVTPSSGPVRDHVRPLDRHRQIGLPALEPMLLYFPPEPDRRLLPNFHDLMLRMPSTPPKKL